MHFPTADYADSADSITNFLVFSNLVPELDLLFS